MLLPLLAVALAGPAETDVPAGRVVALAPGIAIADVVGAPALDAAGDTAVLARLTERGTELTLFERRDGTWEEVRVLVREHSPDRPALDPEGRRLAYVAGPVAALWLLDLETGTRTQLTNTVTDRIPGEPPAGWIPVPHRDPPRFDGDTLVWTSPEGEHRLDLP